MESWNLLQPTDEKPIQGYLEKLTVEQHQYGAES